MYFGYSQYKQKGNTLIFLLIGIFVIAGVAYYLGRSTIQEPLPTLPATSQTPQPTTTPLDETANWKTYTNDKYDYTLKHPNDWQINAQSPQSLYITYGEPKIKSIDPGTNIPMPESSRDPKIYARVSISDIGEKNETVQEIASTWRVGKQETITIAGQPAIRILEYPQESGGEPLVKGAYTLSNFIKRADGNILLIQLETANLDKYQEVFNQILSTFKFL